MYNACSLDPRSDQGSKHCTWGRTFSGRLTRAEKDAKGQGDPHGSQLGGPVLSADTGGLGPCSPCVSRERVAGLCTSAAAASPGFFDLTYSLEDVVSDAWATRVAVHGMLQVVGSAVL